MAHTRRAFAAGLAALPLATTTAASADPALAAIKRYADASVALQAATGDAYADAEAELFASYDALLRTPPRTIEGAQALVNLAIDEDDMQIIEVLSLGLDRLVAA